MEYKELKETVQKYSDSYYKDSKSLVSDFEFDSLMRELEQMELDQGYVDPDSPTQKPGSDLNNDLNTLNHSKPMLSLQNVKSDDEVAGWYQRMVDLGATEFVVEAKIDGTAICLRYKNGKLVKGLSRGNGSIGEDLTQNLSLIVPDIEDKSEIEFRGEAVIFKKDFAKINSNGQYANARNLASGSLKLLDQEEFKKRKLVPIIYWLTTDKFNKHTEDINFIGKQGFKRPYTQLCHSLSDIQKAIIKLNTDRDKLDYEIDGAVIKVNNKGIWEKAGRTAKFPHYAVAYKYSPEVATTVVRKIEYQVGRTGKVTPLAYFDPVTISGSTIQKATLNNKDWMTSLGVRIGDTVEVSKHCEIIPGIDRVLKDKRDGTEVIPKFPEVCPICGSKLIKHNSAFSDYYCDFISCPAKIVNKIVYFTSVMKIDGFAEILTEKLFNIGILNSPEDLLTLKDHILEISKVDRMSENMAKKLVGNIEKAKDGAEAWQLLAALGIPEVGSKTAQILLNHFLNINNIIGASKEELISIDEIGEISADAIINFFKDPANMKTYNAFKNAGYKISKENKVEGTKIFEGKNFVITGALSSPRKEFEKLITDNGGKLIGAVSSKTNYLITNTPDSGTTKNVAARQLGIPIITEEEFLKMLEK